MDKILKEFLTLDVPESMCNETKEFIYNWMKSKFTSYNNDYAVTPTASPKLPSLNDVIELLEKEGEVITDLEKNYLSMISSAYRKLGNFA